MDNNTPKEKPTKPVPKPHPVGLTALDTTFCFMSLLYPFHHSRDIYRYIFLFKENETSGTILDKIRYSELSGRNKAKIKDCEKKKLISFVLLMVMLLVSLFFSVRIFSILMVISLLVTAYDFLDKRICYLWLRREYYRKSPNAQTEPIVGREED